jgi:hypothetical protein
MTALVAMLIRTIESFAMGRRRQPHDRMSGLMGATPLLAVSGEVAIGELVPVELRSRAHG